MSQCYKCGNELTTGDGVDGQCNTCRSATQTAPIGMSGWICPVCGRGLSPYTSQCPCRGWVAPTITYDIGQQ